MTTDGTPASLIDLTGPERCLDDGLEIVPDEISSPRTLLRLRQARRALDADDVVEVDAAVDPATISRWCELTGLAHLGPASAGREVFARRPVDEPAEPLVSVVIPAYRATFLDQVLDSVAEQSYERIEVLIGDDCPDDSVQRAVERRQADLTVRYLGRPAERGSFIGNSRHLLANARGHHVKFLNDDDWLEPGCVERLTACLVQHHEVSLVGSRRRLVGPDDHPLGDPWAVADMAGRRGDDFVAPGDRVLTDVLARGINWPGEPTALQFRRADLSHDPFTIDGRAARRQGDLAMWIRLLARGDLIHLIDPLCTIRFHADQERRHSAYLDLVDDEMTAQRLDAIRIGVLHHDLVGLDDRPLVPRPWWGDSARRALANWDADGDASATWARLQLARLTEPDDPWLSMTSADHLRASGRSRHAFGLLIQVVQAEPFRVDAASRLALLAAEMDSEPACLQFLSHVRTHDPYSIDACDVLTAHGISDPLGDQAHLFAPLDASRVEMANRTLTVT